MAYTFKRFGKTPEFGVGNATTNAYIINSLTATPQPQSMTQTDSYGRTIGKLYFDLWYTASCSGTVLYEHSADVPAPATACTGSNGTITIGDTLSITPYLPAGAASTYFGENSTIICEGGTISASAGDAVSFDFELTAYDFTPDNADKNGNA